MFQTALYPKTKQVLEKLTKVGILRDFYLAGGTALALQLGHRKSVDLDFFINKFPKQELLLQELKPLNINITNSNFNTLDLLIDGVKVTLLEYDYPSLNSLVEEGELKLASILDIACMKLSAISSRGSKKDFVDLYAVINSKVSLSEIFEVFKEKYKGINYSEKHLLKSLTYFVDADRNPEVDYINEKWDWEDIKKFFKKEVLAL